MSERDKYYTGQSLDVRERVSLRIPVPTTLEDFERLALDPITVFETGKESGQRTSGVVKLNQYSATPYEVALFPTHREVSEITDLSSEEGVSIMESAYDTAVAFKSMLGETANIAIGINQHHNVETLPALIDRGKDKVATRVQTINQLHIHVYAELHGEDKVKPFSELSKEKQREIRDPFTFVAAEVMTPHVKYMQSEQPEIWGKAIINDKVFPLGLNVVLSKGLETIKTEGFFTGLQALQGMYAQEYEIISGCFVDKTKTDEYGMFQVRPAEERAEQIEAYLQSHPELSEYTQTLLRYTAHQHSSFSDVKKHFHTFVRGAAFTLGIYENERGETVLNWQPRVISRGNVLSSFGVYRNGAIIPDDRGRAFMGNTHVQLFETMREGKAEGTAFKKGQRIETHVPRLDKVIREEAIRKAKKELANFSDPRGNENILRNLLSGSSLELSNFEADPVLIGGRQLEIEAYLLKMICDEGLKTRIFDKDIVYYEDDAERVISASSQQERLSNYVRQREISRPEKWAVTHSNLAPANSGEPGVIRAKSGDTIYSEQEQINKIAVIGETVKESLLKQGLKPLAFYGRPKSAESIRWLLQSHYKGVKTISDIEDLIGTRAVVEDLEQVEQSVTALETTFGESLLYKRNLYSQPYPHSPLFRSIFLYFHDEEGAISELQVCTRNVALLSSVGHALEFKPKLEENKEHVTELLHIPSDEVTQSHLLQITKYPFESIRKRLETEEWLNYMGKVEGLAELEPKIREQAYKGISLFLRH